MITKPQYEKAKKTIRQYLEENEEEQDNVLRYDCISIIDVVADHDGDDIATEAAMRYAERVIGGALYQWSQK